VSMPERAAYYRLVEFSFKGDAVFPCLKELHIIRCRISVEELPSLRVLTIDGCGDGVLRSVVRVAPSVTEVEIGSISGLTNEVWRGVILDLKAVEELEIRRCADIRYLWESKEAETSSKVLVNLRKLKVDSCKNLVSLGEKDEEEYNYGSNFLTSLSSLEVHKFETLDIRDCDSITCVSYFSKGGGQKLKSVTIEGCEKLLLLKEELGEGEKNMGLRINSKSMPLLENLKIYHHPNVVEFGGSFIHLTKLSSYWAVEESHLRMGPQEFPSTLVDLSLDGEKDAASNWSQLSHIHLPSSLTRLKIESFEKLEIVSEGLQHLTSLQHLEIRRCPKMKDVPETLLPSLLSLVIEDCPILKERCRQTSLGNVNMYMEPKILLHRLCSLRVRTCKMECSIAKSDHDMISNVEADGVLIGGSFGGTELVLSTEEKEYYLEHHIPVAPVAQPGQQIPPEDLAAHVAWVRLTTWSRRKLYEESTAKEDANPALHAIERMGSENKKNITRTKLELALQGLRGSKKLKPGVLSLYVGDGHRAAVEASWYLSFRAHSSGLVIVLKQLSLCSLLTRVYFMAVPRDGIFEIDMSCSNTNDSSIKKRIEKCNLMELLNPIDIDVIRNMCFMLFWLDGRKPYSHQVERAKDLLGLIHTIYRGHLELVSRQGAMLLTSLSLTISVGSCSFESKLLDLKASGDCCEMLELIQEEDNILLKGFYSNLRGLIMKNISPVAQTLELYAILIAHSCVLLTMRYGQYGCQNCLTQCDILLKMSIGANLRILFCFGICDGNLNETENDSSGVSCYADAGYLTDAEPKKSQMDMCRS
ncbi:NB-ARC domains-containing protein, partial [Tanacetum coccineum]